MKASIRRGKIFVGQGGRISNTGLL